MSKKQEGKLYQKVKGNRCPVYLHDENFTVTASIYLSKAISKDYLIKTLDEAKAEAPKLDNPDLNYNSARYVNDNWMAWFERWFGEAEAKP